VHELFRSVFGGKSPQNAVKRLMIMNQLREWNISSGASVCGTKAKPAKRTETPPVGRTGSFIFVGFTGVELH
jgi:hypothetical protein